MVGHSLLSWSRDARRLIGSTIVRDLNPGVFAFVMATGIVSTAVYNDNQSTVSGVLLLMGAIGYLALTAAYGWRLVRWWQRFLADLASPRGFAFLSFAAA